MDLIHKVGQHRPLWWFDRKSLHSYNIDPNLLSKRWLFLLGLYFPFYIRYIRSYVQCFSKHTTNAIGNQMILSCTTYMSAATSIDAVIIMLQELLVLEKQLWATICSIYSIIGSCLITLAVEVGKVYVYQEIGTTKTKLHNY